MDVQGPRPDAACADAPGVRYEERPAAPTRRATAVPGPARRAHHARQPVAAQLLHDRDGQGRDPRHAPRLQRPRAPWPSCSPASGTRAFCTGGNTAEYAEYYAGRPEEYRQYMRLFNDMVSAILICDKPVICRVNGMRIAGGQEIGMACDFSVAQDLAIFGQAGPRHGSAPDGGSTDFLPLFVGIEAAMESCTLCEHWSAHKAAPARPRSRRSCPALKVDGRFVPNPLVVTDRWLDERPHRLRRAQDGRRARRRQGAAGRAARSTCRCSTRRSTRLVFKLANTMPGCLTKTIESVRKHKLEHWDRNRETNRAWLAPQHDDRGARRLPRVPRGQQDLPRGRLPAAAPPPGRGRGWGEALIEEVLARAHGAGTR